MSDTGEPSRQDVALGHDSHCLVTPGQGTAYACAREAALSYGLPTVSPDPASLDGLGLDGTVVEAKLDVPAEDVERMRDVLARVPASGREDARPKRMGL